MRIIWKRKGLLLAVWIGLTIVGGVIVMRLQPIYRAETLVLVESQKIPDKYVASTVIGDVQDRLATLSQEILSTTRLKKIVDDYKLYPEKRATNAFEEIVDMMRRDVDVRLEKGWTNNRPGAFRISYQGPSPTVVAAVANRLASLYIDENLKVREVQAEGTSQFLDTQLREAKRSLDDLELAVSRYKLEHNGELPQQENAIVTGLTRLQTQLQGTQDAINRSQQNKLMYDTEMSTIDARLNTLLAVRDSDSREAEAPLRAAPDRAAPPKKSDIIGEQLRLARSRYSDEHPEVRRIKAALADALKSEQQQSAAAKSAETPTAAAPIPAVSAASAAPPADVLREIDQMQQRRATLSAQRAIAENEIQDRLAERDKLVREMANYQTQLKKLPIREQEMAGLTRDYEMSKANYRSLLDKKTSADLATEMERRQKAERFTVLDPAQVPEKPVKPKRGVLMVVSSVGALALGVALAVAKEWKRNVLLGEWELPPGTVVLGRIPTILIPATAERAPSRRVRKAIAGGVGALSTVLCLCAAAARGWRGL